MKSTTFALGTLFASVAIAQPHRQHQAFHKHQQRDAVVEWVTHVETTTEVVDITTTIWVPEGYEATTSTSEASPSTTALAAQFFETTSSATAIPVAPTTLSTSSILVASAPVSTSSPVSTLTPTPTPSPATIVTPVVTPVASPEVQIQKPTTSTTPIAPVVATTSAAAAASSVASSTTSTVGDAVGAISGDCTGESHLCGGDMTYYDTGYPDYGSCGEQNDGTKEMVVAIAHDFMGTLSNSNPMCGRHVQINYGGKSITAKVVDKCMGCVNRDIDLSHAAFDALSSEGIGRAHATWFFTD